MRIGLVTASDARSRESWSGTHYYMAQALHKHCGELSYLGPIKTIVNSAAGDVAKILQLLSRKRYWHVRSIVVAMSYARILEQRISKQPLDLLVAPLALGACPGNRAPRTGSVSDRCVRRCPAGRGGVPGLLGCGRVWPLCRARCWPMLLTNVSSGLRRAIPPARYSMP